MEHSKQILDELKSISNLVANIADVNPYQVPAEYFENFSADLMKRIVKVEDEKANFLLDLPKIPNPFTLPHNYFDALPGDILKKVKLANATSDEELELLSPLLLRLKNESTYKLPVGYFDELPSTVMSRIESEETVSEKDEIILSPLLGQLKKTVPFKLPEGYFEEFPLDVIAGVNAVDYVNQELEAQAPVMNDLKIQNVYKVPDGYFDNLGTELLNTVRHQRKAPVISFSFSRKILRYGIAALVAGIMSTAAWVFYDNKQMPGAASELAEIQKISSDEMMNYLESTLETPIENTGIASVSIKEEDIKDLFADVPDEELQQYLEQQTVSKDL